MFYRLSSNRLSSSKNQVTPIKGTQDSAWEIFRLTIPQLGLMLCHLAVSMTDIWAAGQMDNRVLATLGFISQISAMLMLLISIVGSGCMATVSQSLGARLPVRAMRYVGLIVGISFLTGGIVAGFSFAALPIVLSLGLVPHNLKPVVTEFSIAYAAQIPFYYCMIMLNSVFRAHKLVWLPFGTLVLVATVNFIGSVGLGLGYWGLPNYGYAAVAWATFFSALLGFACNVALGVKRGILCRASFGPWRWNRVAAPRLWRIGAPAALGNLASQTGGIILTICLAGLPHDTVAAVAGMTLGSRIMGFILLPLGALGMTITVLSGHMLGGRQPNAAYELGRRCAFRAMIFMALAALALGLLRSTLARLLDENAATVAQAGIFLLFACCALPFQALAQMLNAVLAGAGATRFICRINCISTWAVSIPCAWTLSRWCAMGAKGVYVAMALGNICTALWTLRVFQQKKWIRG